MTITKFRLETRAWLEENCPPSTRGQAKLYEGVTKVTISDPDTLLWIERMVEKGWTVPNWPKEYGGGGLTTEEYAVLMEEMSRIEASLPLEIFGTSMIGPTLLEFGAEEQKARHLPPIARGDVVWCQGYSEPGSGSDLASLQTQAVLKGDNFVINGSKIWTSGAHKADWMFILVRTDKDVSKHDGISFMLLPMDQPGVTVRPIAMISGISEFNQVFFDNAKAARDDLVGELNRGWTVGKRLLQHERSGMKSLVSESSDGSNDSLIDEARKFLGEINGKIADPVQRNQIITYQMNQSALRLTQRRVVEESGDGATPGPATSIFKTVNSELEQEYISLLTKLNGSRAFGVDESVFTPNEIDMTRQFFFTRALSIASGSNEVQRNIIAKRVLGLPD